MCISLTLLYAVNYILISGAPLQSHIIVSHFMCQKQLKPVCRFPCSISTVCTKKEKKNKEKTLFSHLYIHAHISKLNFQKMSNAFLTFIVFISLRQRLQGGRALCNASSSVSKVDKKKSRKRKVEGGGLAKRKCPFSFPCLLSASSQLQLHREDK